MKSRHSAPMGPPPPPPPPVSDVRLKTNVERIGTAKHDLPLYSFSYLDKDGVYEGVMAQDVIGVMPAAVVVGEDGYYRVNYEMLGIEFRRTA